MMQTTRQMLIIVLFLAPAGAAATPAAAQTLWQNRDEHKAFLFRDLKARQKGDVLTIVISENTDVANSDRRGLNKSAAASSSGSFSYDVYGGDGDAAAQFGQSSQRQFDGGANYSSDREFSDRVAVSVVEMLPNGNLIVAGSRDIFVEGDHKTLMVSGIVRGLDIRPDNSILSRHVSNLKIQFQGSGTESNFTNQGWLGRQINKFWPF